MQRRIAISACLLGVVCRYDAKDNTNHALLKALKEDILIPFCPEDHAFGTPRPSMDLQRSSKGDCAISSENGKNLSGPIEAYARTFFDQYPEFDLFIGKDRSPSCGVCTARVYDEDKNLLSSTESGLMAKEAKKREIISVDAELFTQFGYAMPLQKV